VYKREREGEREVARLFAGETLERSVRVGEYESGGELVCVYERGRDCQAFHRRRQRMRGEYVRECTLERSCLR
jgi:hypothetical protein